MKNESPILKRLGSIPFWRGEEKFLTVLEKIYARAKENATRVLAENKKDQD